MIKRYIKKPVAISAIEIKKDNIEEITSFITKYNLKFFNGKKIKILTMEGIMNGKVGDYIICGVKNEPYICKKEIFMETYEEEKND